MDVDYWCNLKFLAWSSLWNKLNVLSTWRVWKVGRNSTRAVIELAFFIMTEKLISRSGRDAFTHWYSAYLKLEIFVKHEKVVYGTVVKHFFKRLCRATTVVYKSSCVQRFSTYICKTFHHLLTRIADHKEISIRTGEPFMTPSDSSIRDHALIKNFFLNHVLFIFSLDHRIFFSIKNLFPTLLKRVEVGEFS